MCEYIVVLTTRISKKCKVPVKSTPPTYQHSVSSRPDALPVTQTTAASLFPFAHYLHQQGHVFNSVSWFICLLEGLHRNYYDNFTKFSEKMAHGLRNKSLDFGVVVSE